VVAQKGGSEKFVGIVGKLDKIYIIECTKYMYRNKMNKIWDSYLPCIADVGSIFYLFHYIYIYYIHFMIFCIVLPFTLCLKHSIKSISIM
jgi:dolichyl-phosphate-mannose--protein O-mannosyl transferase